MNDPLPPHLEPRRRRWPWFLLGLFIALILVGQGYRLFVRHQVQGKLNALRQQGYPVSGYELESWVKSLPDTENAALPIIEAGEKLSLPRDAFDHMDWGRSGELGPEERDDLRRLITNNLSALELVHAAAQLKQSRYPVDYQRGPDALLPHLAKVKSLTQLLKIQCTLQSEEGRPDLAVPAILDAVALARSLDTEPLFISQLVRTACLTITCSSLERLLTQHALNEPQLEQLSGALDGALESSQAAFARGFVGETCLGIYCFTMPAGQFVRYLDADNFGGNANVSAIAQVALPLYAWSGLRDRDFRFYLEMMAGMLEAAKTPFPENLPKTRQTTDRLEKTLQSDKLLVCSRMLLPALQKANAKEAELQGRLRAAQTALAIERFRTAHQASLPEDLAQLVPSLLPELPRDPIDGAPLRFHKRNPGYVVYSVGIDGEDNGGEDRNGNGSPGARKWPPQWGTRRNARMVPGQNYDVTFTVER
jgi:hypothetical protein